MFQLRWANRKTFHPQGFYSIPARERVLQYRTIRDGVFNVPTDNGDMWTPWRDVEEIYVDPPDGLEP